MEITASGNGDPKCIAPIKHEIYVTNEYVNIKRNPISLVIGILPMARLSSTLGASFSRLALSPLKPPNIFCSLALEDVTCNGTLPNWCCSFYTPTPKKTFWYIIKLLRKLLEKTNDHRLFIYTIESTITTYI